MGKTVTIGTPARDAILKGALQVAKAVGCTYGPLGRHCLMDRMAGLITTKDGVTVARELEDGDRLQNQGTQILKTACIKVNDLVGDGTTTTAVMAAEMLRLGHKQIVAGQDPMQIARGMLMARDAAVEILEDEATPVTSLEDLERVAMLASNGDEPVAKTMAKACMAVGKDGTISIRDGVSIGVELELKEGLELDRGAVSPTFLDPETQSREFDGPLVAVINRQLSSVADVQEMLEVASQWRPRELLVFSLGVEGEALTTMLMNDNQGTVKSCAVVCPGFGHHKADYLMDLAALTGADFVDREAGYDSRKWDPEWFGALRAAKVTASRTQLEAYDEASETIQEQATLLRGQMDSVASEYDRDLLKERLAKLTGGLAIMKVGDFTESALKERRARVEDALGSVQASLRGGVLPGGGSSYVRAYVDMDSPDELKDGVDHGWEIVRQGLLAPTVTLANNAGLEGRAEVQRLIEQLRQGSNVGLDVVTGKLRPLLDEPQILDPVPVAVSALQSAVSVASTLLTVEAAITMDHPNQ